jgi:hypothetical protein
MTSIKRYAGAGSAAMLLALSLSACGGAPTDASTEDFCDAYGSIFDTFSDIDPEASPSDQADTLVDGFKEFSDKLDEVGTPDGISDDAREGFELTVDELGDLDADDVQKAIEEGNDEFAEISDDDQKKVDAFDEFASGECGELEAPTE